MNIEVHIDGRIAHKEEIEGVGIIQYAKLLHEHYKLDMWRRIKVDAFIIIGPVQSKMNRSLFEPKKEAYDHYAGFD